MARMDFVYGVGTILEKENRKVEIIEQFYKYVPSAKSNRKHYKYKCLIDGYIGDIDENALLKNGATCSACRGRAIVVGVNDIATTHPHIVKYLFNENDAYRYTKSSHVKIKVKCPDCGYTHEIVIDNLCKRGFSCSCGDNISYPQKFFVSLLNQCGVKFEIEKSFNWSKNIIHENKKISGDKRYDFYIPSSNTIIEVHGGQHYIGGFERLGGRTLQDEQENDILKESIAKENGIINYISIDCRNSEIDFIKNNVLSSNLDKFINMTDIDWVKCGDFANKSLVKISSELYNEGMSSGEIANKTGLSIQTIIKYLKQGAEIKLNNYEPREFNKKVILINNLKVYESAKVASDKLNVNKDNINSCCNENLKTWMAGTNEFGENYIWLYYEDYLSKSEDEINILKKLINKNVIRSLVCLNNGMVFRKVKDAVGYFAEHGIKICATSIRNVCYGELKHTKGYTFKYLSDLTQEEKQQYGITT